MSEEGKKHIVTPTGQICFIKNLFEPNEDGNYSATLLLNTDQDTKPLKNLMMGAARTKFDEDVIKSKKFKWGVKKPDSESINQYDFMTDDTLVLNCSTKFPVEVKGPNKGSDGKYETLLDGDLKAGDFCRLLVSAYPWEYKGKTGVSLNLLAVQMIKEGEALYSRRPSDDFFDEAELDVKPEVSKPSDEEVDGDDAIDW